MKITHHYKLFISALTTMALLYSAILQADILDGGEIQFHGFVTDETPKWTWQISSPGQTGQWILQMHIKITGNWF